MNPACKEVDPSLCLESASEPEANAPAHWSDGPTQINAKVYEPLELGPFKGGAQVKVAVYNYRMGGALQEVASGETNENGSFTWKGNAPSPNSDYHFKITVNAPGNIKSFDVPARNPWVLTQGAGGPSVSSVTVVACPSGTNALVCAVAQGQLDWKAIYDQQILAWGDSPQGRAFAADQAHANVTLTDPVLKGGWWLYSWWLGDRGIPPKDWPALVDRVNQIGAIFSKIPFPRWPGIEDLFERCAKGIPITQGRNGENFTIMSARLYSDTWSDYFPREDSLIEKDMAAAYSDGLQSILACMVHRLKQKSKEIERTAKAMSVVSLVTVVAFSPFLVAAGPSGISVLGTEVWEFTQFQGGADTSKSYGVTAALAASMIAAGNIDFVVAAMEPAINEILKDADPAVAKAVTTAYPQIIESAIDAVVGPSGIGSEAAAGGGAVGGAAVAMAVKLIAGIAKGYAAKRMEEFGDAAQGANQAAVDVLSFAQGEGVSPYFKPFIQWVVTVLDLEEMFEDAIDRFLDEIANAMEEGEAQGGGIAIVPEEGGGGLAVAPTDGSGVPTDPNGAPLPGGEAPLTKPVDPFAPSTGEVVGALGVGAIGIALVAVGSGVL